MKNTQRGFVVQGVLALVALVLISFGAYFVSMNKPLDCCHGEQYENMQISEWQTYTNESLGFEFKYPNTFEVLPDSSGMNPGAIMIMHPEDKNKTDEPLDAIFINVIENKEKLSVTDWWNKKYGPYTEKNNEIGLTPNTLPIKKMVVDGNEGIYIGGSEGVLSNYLILSRGDKILEINLMANDSMKIISTFKFTSTPSSTETKTMKVTIMVPDNMPAYEKAMNDYIFNGKTNPAKTWAFVQKKITVPSTTDIIPASVQAAAEQIPSQGISQSYQVAYLKVKDGTAYVLLGMHLDGWAGVSASIAKIEPIVEKTLLQFPGITSVKFGPAPGDTMESIQKSYMDTQNGTI